VPFDLHIGIALHEDSNSKVGIGRKTAAGRWDDRSRNGVAVEVQLDVISSERYPRTRPNAVGHLPLR
jgi:hypothetical protein